MHNFPQEVCQLAGSLYNRLFGFGELGHTVREIGHPKMHSFEILGSRFLKRSQCDTVDKDAVFFILFCSTMLSTYNQRFKKNINLYFFLKNLEIHKLQILFVIANLFRIFRQTLTIEFSVKNRQQNFPSKIDKIIFRQKLTTEFAVKN